jgi:hypothetical protein
MLLAAHAGPGQDSGGGRPGIPRDNVVDERLTQRPAGRPVPQHGSGGDGERTVPRHVWLVRVGEDGGRGR